MRKRTLLLLLSLGSLSACMHTSSTLDSQPDMQSTGPELLPDTKPHYYLPVGQLNLEISRTLNCSKDTRLASIDWAVSGSVKAIADKTNALPLSLDQLEHFGRDTAATFSFSEDGRITSINIDSKDQVGPTISSIVTGITKIGVGLATADVFLQDRKEADDEGRYLCPEEIADIFDSARGIAAQIQIAEKKRAGISGRLAQAAPGSSKHDEIRMELAGLDKNINEYRSELAKLLAPYKFVSTMQLIPEITVDGTEVPIDPVPDKVLVRWLGESATMPPSGGLLSVTPEGTWGSLPSSPDGTKFYVRMPGTAKVMVSANCMVPEGANADNCELFEGQEEAGTAIVFHKSLGFPQAGRLLAVNLDARIFRDKLINIELHPNGTLKTYGATEKSGLGAVSNTITGLQQSVDAYTAYRAARDAENNALNELNDENALLEAQIKYLENKKKLYELEAQQQTAEP